MKIFRTIGYIFLTAFFAFAGMTVHAQDGQLTIESGSIQYDSESGNSVFVGSVLIVRGGLEIQADRVEHFRESDNGEHLVAEGQPVKFTYESPDTGEMTNGWADDSIYWFERREIELSGNVVIQNDQVTLRAQKAFYNSDTGNVRTISSPAESDERAKSTIVIDDDS